MKIAVLTSGGVAPGMNAAVRAVAQRAFYEGWEVLGVQGGYGGLLEGRLEPVDARQLGGMMHRGGTALGTDRSKGVREPEGQRRVAGRLDEAGVDALVIVGGGGSMTSALALHESGVPAVGIPATIDNDVWGTDLAIGVDTAIETAVGIIDRIRGTAISHNRAHIVKVAGSDSGYLALMSALAGGAEAAVVPEFEMRAEELMCSLKEAYDKGKPHFIIVVAEGAELGAEELQECVNRAGGTYGADLTDIGHVQTGGDPTSDDRILASRMGAAAVEAVSDGETGTMVGAQGEETVRVPLSEVSGKDRPLDPEMYRLARILGQMHG